MRENSLSMMTRDAFSNDRETGDAIRFDVPLGARAYPIWIGRGLAGLIQARLAPYLASKVNLGCVVDDGVRQAGCLASIVPEVARIDLDGRGETLKCFAMLEHIVETLAARRVDRSGALVALGGGVVGDLTGFAAASYLRGIDFFQVPTTLLAMVDSSVGGKTGINLRAGKNLTGAFWQPKAVFIDLDVLRFLPEREFAAGMAEVIKYGMLDDEPLYRQLGDLPKLNPDSPELAGIVQQCCEIKARIVVDDETETAANGGRARLNLGHTFAHAIEAVAGYGEYLHGEAVAIGLVLAAKLSHRLGEAVTEVQIDALRALLTRYGLPVELRPGSALSARALLDAMSRDKKVRDGHLHFVVMPRIGETVTRGGIDATLVQALWQEAGAAS